MLSRLLPNMKLLFFLVLLLSTKYNITVAENISPDVPQAEYTQAEDGSVDEKPADEKSNTPNFNNSDIKARNLVESNREKIAEINPENNEGFTVKVIDGAVSLRAIDASLSNILLEIGRQAGLEVEFVTNKDRRVSEIFNNIPLDEALLILSPNQLLVFKETDGERVIAQMTTIGNDSSDNGNAVNKYLPNGMPADVTITPRANVGIVNATPFNESNDSVTNTRAWDKLPKLGPGDIVFIRVVNEPDLTMQVVVSSAGVISYSYLGQIVVSNFTAGQLEAEILDRLESGYLKDPEVSITIKEFKTFFIEGEVRSPGAYPYESGLTLARAVSMADGLTDRASRKRISLVRKIEGVIKAIDRVNMTHTIEPGDRITVNEGFF